MSSRGTPFTNRGTLATAAERTVSLFTGQTDLEGGGFARDGSQAEPPRIVRSRPAPKWKELRGERRAWECRDLGSLIEVDVGKYNVTVRGVRVGSFDNIHDAANAAERR